MDSSHPTPPDHGAAAFDRASLLHRLMDDEELVAELIEAFLDDAPRLIRDLEESYASGDLTKTERQAHRIKGAAANLSANRLRDVLEALELAAREGQRDTVALLIPRVAAEYRLAETAMREGGAP